MSGLLRSNVVVATGTALSRFTGLLRVVVFGYVVGQTSLSDVYKLANETPNIVYDLLIGGVLSATLVPMFTSFLVDDDEESQNVVVTTAVVAVAALTAIAVVAAPLVFRLYTLSPAEGVDPALLHDVGTTLTRIFLLQILFYGLTGIAAALLNSRQRFFAAAWSPILANLIIIVTLLSLPDPGDAGWGLSDVVTNDRLRWTLGVGATAGIAAMALVLVPAVAAAGVRYRPVWNLRHPAVRRLLTLSGWTLGFVLANQVAVVVIRNLTDPGSGGSDAYFVAFTFFVLPHGLLAVSIATTFQPELARSVSRRDRTSFVDRMSLGTRLVALLTVPAGAALFVLRRSIIGAALQHGEFDASDALVTSRALGGFALGLVGFSVYLFALRGFYAHQDTRTPFVLNVVQNGLNIVLAFALVDRYGVLGLGASYAVSYLVCAAWSLQVLAYKVPGFPTRAVLGSIGRMLLAGLLAAEAMWLVARVVGGNVGADAWARLVAAGAVGLVAYAGALALLGAPELAAARTRLRRAPG